MLFTQGTAWLRPTVLNRRSTGCLGTCYLQWPYAEKGAVGNYQVYKKHSQNFKLHYNLKANMPQIFD